MNLLAELTTKHDSKVANAKELVQATELTSVIAKLVVRLVKRFDEEVKCAVELFGLRHCHLQRV